MREGCFVANGALWNVVVVQLQILQQSGLQISPAIETGLLQQLVDAPVDSLDHAIGLRMARRRQPMLGRQGGASNIESVFATGLFVFGGDKACPPSPGNQDPCKGLREQLAADEEKYRQYMANPSAGDNTGALAAANKSGNMTRYTNIINGRLRSLDGQIQEFRRQLEQCERTHGK